MQLVIGKNQSGITQQKTVLNGDSSNKYKVVTDF